MTPEELIEQGNQYRESRDPERALECYALAFAKDRRQAAAFNNYGNVLREIGDPWGAAPFLQRAITLYPNFVTAKFNLAVAHLLVGDYEQGWAGYESRWDYEHLAGTLPQFDQPRWSGQDLNGKTILIVGEQGHGDNIQFARFLYLLKDLGARVLFQVTAGLVPVMQEIGIIDRVGTYGEDLGQFDFWCPIMSIPNVLKINLNNLPAPLGYLRHNAKMAAQWTRDLGPKTKMRIGLAWSGRRDSWINQHKSIPFDQVVDFVASNPNYDWINLQADCTVQEQDTLAGLGVRSFPGKIQSFADTTALMSSMDQIISVDTAIAHLAGSLGKPTWLMLNHYAVDWRWMLNRKDSPWYPSMILFRQAAMGDWGSVFKEIKKQLELAKI